jgi:hypothetical protein
MSKKAEETIKLLNLLGQCYNAYDGFSENNEIKEDLDDDFLMDILNTEYSKEHYDLKPDDYISFKIWFLERESETEIVYDTVILKLPNDYWNSGKPHLLTSPKKIFEWYNDSSEESNNISSRPYIKINIKYEKITISSKEKGSPINFEDVLFATRGMCLDGDRYVVNMDYGGYKLRERMGNSLLVLEPGIENFEH